MKEEEKTEKNEILDKIETQVEEKIKTIADNGIKSENIENLYKLIDIHKDIANENYWKVKEEKYMRYGEYEGYGAYGRRSRDSRGRYTEGGSYGRRGVKGSGRGRYRGEDMMDEMAYHYGNYMEGGQYGAEAETTEALEYMMEATTEFIKMLTEEAKSPEELKIIKHYSKKISEM